jgi:hypothetical protein
MKVTVVTLSDTNIAERYVAVVEGVVQPATRQRWAKELNAYLSDEAPELEVNQPMAARYLYFREMETSYGIPVLYNIDDSVDTTPGCKDLICTYGPAF